MFVCMGWISIGCVLFVFIYVQHSVQIDLNLGSHSSRTYANAFAMVEKKNKHAFLKKMIGG